MELAAKLGLPVLPTEECTSPSEVYRLFSLLSEGDELILKGEGGSAGSAVRALRAGERLAPEDWEALTLHSPRVLVQRRLHGPKIFVTVVYERGLERAACAHEKISTWPSSFGVSAVGVTRYVKEVHDYTQSLFEALQWHGLANIEFRQDRKDGCWYFMEINPRVNCSLGIQAKAGVDVVSCWAAVCLGQGSQFAPGRAYRSGVRYWWTVPTLALSMRKPWMLPLRQLLPRDTGSDWPDLDLGSRWKAFRAAFWEARNRRT